MDGIIIKYYQFNNLINRLPSVIKDKFNYDDSLLLSLLSFKSSARFYSKRDKHQIYNRIDSELYKDFILDSAINLSINNDYEKLLFLYGLIISDTTSYYLKIYLEQISDEYSFNESLNMVDKIYADKNNLNINESILKQFPTAFIYHKYMDELIHTSFIRNFGFFSTDNYFKIAYKKMRKFYKKNTKNKIGNLDKNETIYPETYSTKIFNKDRNEFVIDNKKYKYELNEFINFIDDIIYKKIDALNNYLFFNQEKDFIKEFNIPKDKKI